MLSAVSGSQVLQLERLSEVDPAIFTDVRDYDDEDIEICLPADQLHENEVVK